MVVVPTLMSGPIADTKANVMFLIENNSRYLFSDKSGVASFENMGISPIEQSRLEHPNVSDADHVRRIAARLVDELDLHPPVDVELAASYQDVARVEVVNIPWAGCLLTVAGDVVIRVRDTDSQGRRRFTIPHEISHTFFKGYQEQPQYRCSPVPAAQGRRQDLEWLCDVGAGALLFPLKHFGPEASSARFGFDAVGELADRYDASLTATAHAFVEAQLSDTLFVILERRTKPSQESDAQPRLRVASAHPKGNWPFVPRHKSAPDKSLLTHALEGWPIDEIGDLTGITAAEQLPGVQISARYVPYTDDQGTVIDRVFALYQRPRSSA